MDRLEAKWKKIKSDDIIVGPLDLEKPGIFLSNLVNTDKKDSDRIRVTLDCQAYGCLVVLSHFLQLKRIGGLESIP